MHFNSFPNLEAVLACPVCKGDLNLTSERIECRSCRRAFPQPDGDWFELLPGEPVQRDENWERRQHEMAGWYQDLIASPEDAARSLEDDYASYAEELSELSGSVLDIGGGSGIPRHFLAPGTRYVVVEPSLDWLQGKWEQLTDVFPCLESRPSFVRGVGEYLPFAAGTFDAVLVFWALNHVSRPEAVLRETARVLRPGARLIVVLEDMIPRLRDLLDPDFPAQDIFTNVFDPEETLNPRHPRLQLLRRMNPARWPLQTDHIRIREPDIYRWVARNFVVSKRYWVMHFLTLVFEKLSSRIS